MFGDKCRRDRTTYATIIVKPTVFITGRATPPHRQNQPSVALLTSDYRSETRNYKDRCLNCQARCGAVWRSVAQERRSHQDCLFSRLATPELDSNTQPAVN